MRDEYKDLVIGTRMRLLELYRGEVYEARKESGSNIRFYMKGLLMGLKLALMNVRWLHREIRRKEEQGYTLVWLTEQERDLLNTFNP